MFARRLLAVLPLAMAGAVQAQTQDLGEGFLCCNMRASSENPSLDAKAWKYWLSSFAPFTVHFGDDNRVSKVEGDTDTLAKVYAR